MLVTSADVLKIKLLCNSEMPGRRCRCGVAVVRGRVYGVGGFNGSLRVRREKLLLEKVPILQKYQFYQFLLILWALKQVVVELLY